MLSTSNKHLFIDGDLCSTLDAHLAKVDEEVNNIPKNQFLCSNDQDIEAHLLSKMVINPLELHLDSMEMETQETQITLEKRRSRSYFDDNGVIKVPGVRVTVTIPFSGEHLLWKLKPSSWSSILPFGIVKTAGSSENGSIDMVFEQRSGEPPESLKQELDQNIGLIQKYLTYQQNDIKPRNERLPDLIQKAIKARRDRLEKQEGLIKHLNIPLKSKDGVPPIRPIQVEHRLVHQLPIPPKGGYKPEWGISDNDYEDIISIIRHEGRTFESTPSTYKAFFEEDLRNILLAHLNGHYKGGATGETFRNSGKTDIRIEMENRAAFIAECKVWRGSQELSDAIDQLLGYLTWYDCKTALIIFNKQNAKFSEILDKVPETMKNHKKFLKVIDEGYPGDWRYSVKSPDDEDRRITVHVFLFNLYSK